MFNVLAEINWLAVLIAFIVSAALAWVYFAYVIAKPYVVALGRQNAAPPASSMVTNLGPVVCVLITTVTTAILLRALDVTTIGDALVFGLLVGIGYLSAMTFQIAINPNFPRPLYYGVLNSPFFIISSLLTSVIVTLIR
jgi:hypothetical protein